MTYVYTQYLIEKNAALHAYLCLNGLHKTFFFVFNQLNFVVVPHLFFFFSSSQRKPVVCYFATRNSFFFSSSVSILDESMVSLLTIEILSILATTITNLLGIVTFATDYWTIIVYDLVKLRSTAQWIAVEQNYNGNVQILNITNETQLDFGSSEVVFGTETNYIFSKIHKGLFRQCNYLSEHLRNHLKLPRCQPLKSTHNQYDDLIHGMINPGREYIRKYYTSNSFN